MVLSPHFLFPLKCNAFPEKKISLFIYIIWICVVYFETIKIFNATANAPSFTDVLPFYHSAKCHKMRYINRSRCTEYAFHKRRMEVKELPYCEKKNASPFSSFYAVLCWILESWRDVNFAHKGKLIGTRNSSY